MRQMLETFINALRSAQANSVCGAEFGSRGPDRTNRRDGYRHRDLDTRVGTLDVAVPKLREGRSSRTGCWLAAAGRRRR
jgi:transposase-like protein